MKYPKEPTFLLLQNYLVRIAYATTYLACILLLIEFSFRTHQYLTTRHYPSSMNDLATMALHGTPENYREKNSRFIIHNLNHFLRNPPDPSIDSAFLGSSRSKYIAPHVFYSKKILIAASNSYNEMTLAPLVEAEIMRINFPQLKTFYFEASFLHRRPNLFFMEEDHKKYYFILDKLLYDIDSYHEIQKAQFLSPRHFISYFKNFKLTFFKSDGSQRYHHTSEIPYLSRYGESQSFGSPWKPTALRPDNIKILRVKENKKFIPGNHLFEMILKWGKMHKIEIGLYSTPLHRLLYNEKSRLGLQLHIKDLERISLENKIPFLNFLNPDLGWLDQNSLYADEDHLASCEGAQLFTAALISGFATKKTPSLSGTRKANLPLKKCK